MPAAAPTAESPARPSPPSPAAFLDALAGRALLFAELCGLPGAPALATLEQAMRDWNRRRRRQPPAQWAPLFWRALLRRTANAPAATPAAADADLAQALRALPVTQRQAFLLRVWLGFDLPALADLLGVPADAAGRLLVAALQQLRSQLGVPAGDERWVLHGRAALELRAGTLAVSRQAALAAARERALAPARRPRRAWLLLPAAALALLFGHALTPPTPSPAIPPALPQGSLDSATAVPAEPLEQLLSLPAEDFALLADPAAFELLAELEFHLWRLEQAADAH